MTRRPLTRLLALAGCLGAAALPACGADDEPSGEPIPRATVAELDKQLTSIENRFEFGDGACADIQNDNAPSVEQILADLPSGVEQSVRRALRQSFDRLFELARSRCDEDRNQPTETTEAPTTTTPPPTTEAPVTTETVTTETVTTETVPPPTATTPAPQTQGQSGGRGPQVGQSPGASGGAPPSTGGAEGSDG